MGLPEPSSTRPQVVRDKLWDYYVIRMSLAGDLLG